MEKSKFSQETIQILSELNSPNESPVFSAHSAIGLLEEIYGIKLNPDLSQLIQCLSRKNNNKDLGEYCPARIHNWLPSSSEINSMEFMMTEAFRCYSVFCQTLFLGTTSAGDHWYFSLTPQQTETEVYLVDHETSEIEPICLGIENFTLLHHAIEKSTLTDFSRKRLLGAVNLPRDLAVLKLPASSGLYRSELKTVELFKQSYGIATHLHGQWPGQTPNALTLGETTLEDLKKNLSQFSFGEILIQLWYLYFRSEDLRLTELIRICSQSHAKIIRDTCSLLEEILNGREKVGRIENILKLRRGDH